MVERYANGHLINIFSEKQSPIMLKIASTLGVTPTDFVYFDSFLKRTLDISTLAH